MYKLQELLARLPGEYLGALANTLARFGVGETELERRLGETKTLLKITDFLGEPERKLLKMMVASGVEKGIESSLVWRIVDALDTGGGAGRLVCERLRAHGLIFESMSGHGRTRYIMPLEIFKGLSGVFYGELAATLPDVADCDVENREKPGRAMLSDIVHLLASLAVAGAQMTQNGEIWKKDLVRIERGFLARDWFRSGPPYRPEFPGRTAFMVEYCLERALIGYAGKGVGARKCAREWVDRPLISLHADVYCFWRDWFLPRLGHVEPFLEVAGALPEGRWFSYEDLLSAVEPLIIPGEWPDNLAVQLGGMLRSGVHAGLFEAGSLGIRPVYCLTWLGRALLKDEYGPGKDEPKDRLYLQPSFEVLADLELSPGVQWRLELMCELVRIDGLRTYRLTRESLHAGLRWLTLDEFLQFLKEYGQGQPGNVLFTLKDWGGGFGRARFIPGIVLKCDDAVLLETIMHSPRLEGTFRERLNDQVMLIASEGRPAVENALSDLGVTLRPGSEEDPAPRNSSDSAEAGGARHERLLASLHLNGFLPLSGERNERDSRRDLLGHAIEGGKRLRISWSNAWGNRRTGKVDPLALVAGENGWELLCVPDWAGLEMRLPLSELRAVEVLDEAAAARRFVDEQLD